MALRALKRMDGAPVRKLPVTPEMIRWICATSAPLGDAGRATRAAITTGFFFLLRSGEYLGSSDRGWDQRTILLGRDVEFRKNGALAPPGVEPDEVTIRIRGSKTDQLNAGEVRNHFRSGDASICVVHWTLIAWYSSRSPRLAGASYGSSESTKSSETRR